MLVSELKKEIKKYNKKELEDIIVELYKRIPKNKKEDYNVDEYIKNIQTKNNVKKEKISIEELEKEITYFLQCVDNEYYVVPNKIVSKKERSSWRFKVKRYYKELKSIPPASPDGFIATILLIKIFKRLSIGSNRLLFINWETFRALGVSQAEYYDTIIKRILSNGYTEDNLKKCVELLDIDKDPYELSYDMFWTYISNLKTTNDKEKSIELMDIKIKELCLKIKNIKDSHNKFYIEKAINDYTECITEIYFILGESISGISYFSNNYIEDNKEVKEYILLEKLEQLDLLEEWINEYEKNINKIDFRDSLKEKYKKIKKDLSSKV